MIKEYLNQPYPLFKNGWKAILIISLFVGVFMLVFEPFGISSFSGKLRVYFEMGYGLVTLGVLIFNLLLLPRLINDWFVSNKWTVFKQIIFQIWILFSIGLFNFLYTSVFITFTHGFLAFVVFQFYTLVVGIFPILVITIINQNRLLSKNLILANEMNNDVKLTKQLTSLDEKICIVAENNKDKLEINLSDLLYVTSTGNYIQVFYLKENELKNIMLRNTLKQAEVQLNEFHSVIKCHRAFLVNKNKIVRVKGNSQGLRLILKGTEEEIPVSKNYSKDMKQTIYS